MLRYLLSNRWIQAGVVLLVVCVVGSLLYSWHVQPAVDADRAAHERFSQSLDSAHKTPTTKSVNTTRVTFAETPTESISTDTSQQTATLSSGDPELDDTMDAVSPDDLVSTEEQAVSEEVRVSPFGFGPYPEVPADLPETIPAPWDWDEDMKHKFHDHLRQFELMARVLIKLWNEGDRGFTGGQISENGTVYPNYPNTVYVRYTEGFDLLDWIFSESRISWAIGGPGVSDEDIKMIRDGKTPPGIRILDMDTDGVNAYSFLNIK